MNTFKLTVSSPDGDIFQGNAVKVSLRGANGDLAIMAGHIPFITSIQPCDCHIEFDDGTKKIGHAEGGILTVSNEKVTILSGSFAFL